MLTCSLQSGSNGNAIYVEAAGVRLLFDAGISGRQVRRRLEHHGRDAHGIDALFLSHGHGDHIRCAGIYQRLFQVPIYAAPATRQTLARFEPRANVSCVCPGETIMVGPATVHFLPTPHDARESVAFVVECEGKRLGILTDLGHPFAALPKVLDELDAVYLESNYDVDMLAAGPYPPDLQERIRGGGGHLSNDEAADLLHSRRCRRLKWAMLAHLSEENNHPDVALETHRKRLGRDYPLFVASRYDVSGLHQV